MPNNFMNLVYLSVVVVGLAGCTESRRDPCQLLTVQDMKSIDKTITTSLWAGRDGERKDDEVCAYYAGDGDPRAMVFVWYDKEKDPFELAELAAAATNGQVENVPDIGSGAAAFFQDEELEFLAAKSAQGVIGIRTKSSVKKNSRAYDQLALLANRALSRKR